MTKKILENEAVRHYSFVCKQNTVVYFSPRSRVTGKPSHAKFDSQNAKPNK